MMFSTSNIRIHPPDKFNAILANTEAAGFNMASEIETGTMLRFLCATKPGGRFLELGGGTGLSTSWILQGMDESSQLITVDNDESVLNLAKDHIANDTRVDFVLSSGIDVIRRCQPGGFDLIFADAWDGRYCYLDETLV